ncbi:MAG: ATP-binding cassette domain-containing protein, partial [Candidatus Puniceispirillaceae bacterium]
MAPLLEVSNIRKSFGSLVANRDISFTVDSGEVLAILGENGAGKTTLMNIIFGHYLADGGVVQCAGRELRRGDPRAAIEAGIGMVHQHFTLAENLTVLENTLIGTQSLWKPMLSTAEARQKLVALADQFGLEMNPDAYVHQMSVGEKQRLEILKTLINDCRLLILDEPTASLTPQESNGLFDSIRKMVSAGLGVIIISHKLNEIMQISDRIIVLRAGETVGTVRTADASKRQLGEMIVGQKITRPERRSSRMSDPKIKLENICTRKTNLQAASLKNIDLTVRGGEIMGVVGVADNGQRSLAEVMSGH